MSSSSSPEEEGQQDHVKNVQKGPQVKSEAAAAPITDETRSGTDKTKNEGQEGQQRKSETTPAGVDKTKTKKARSHGSLLW